MSGNEFQGYAEFSARLAAFMIDILILVLAVICIIYVPGTLLTVLGKHKLPVMFLTTLLFAVLFLLYFPFMESSPEKATIGKRLLGLSVTDGKGRRLDFRHALIRTLGKCIPIVVFAVFSEIILRLLEVFQSAGLLICVPILFASLWCYPIRLHPKKLAMHDILAGSLVIKSE
jgi:uncharacterized RDD family membrane protein YckC